MSPIDPLVLEAARSRDELTVKCEHCESPFVRTKNQIQASIKRGKRFYCTSQCSHNATKAVRPTFQCEHCGTPFQRKAATVNCDRRRGQKHLFCSQSCSAHYHNIHNKKVGGRRSKMEHWIEEVLKTRYPHLNILFNDKTAINAELDIYIPSLKLAFELNGPFHYEPIFGQGKLESTQSNDQRKLHKCTAAQIDLCVIDVSKVRYFKPQTCQSYLNIITNIIDGR